MSFVPEFTIGIPNGWWFLVPYLVVMTLQPMIYANRKQILKRLMYHPRTTGKEKRVARMTIGLYYAILIYSIFLPLNVDSVWFWSGSVLFISAMIAYISAVHHFAVTPLDKPVVTGLYRISRNPIHFFSFVAWTGIGIAAASWILLIANLVSLAGIHVGTLAEERYCLRKYGDPYRHYMDTVPRYFLFF